MEQKEVKITIPEGYEIDKEKSTFECVIFKPKKGLPKTWEEFCSTHDIQESEYWSDNYSKLHHFEEAVGRNPDSDKDIFPSKELAEAMLALCQLIQLRDCYNNGWQPDWKREDFKYNITFVNNEIFTSSISYMQRVLSFKSRELRDEFLENFKDLIETAKPLL